jgi:hypothetical protein
MKKVSVKLCLFSCLALFACSKSEDFKQVPNDHLQKNLKDDVDELTPDVMSRIIKNYYNFRDQLPISGNATAMIPLRTAVRWFEVVLNSEYAVTQGDEDFRNWDFTKTSFTITPSTNLGSEPMFTIKDIFTKIAEVETFINTQDIADGRKIIAIDIEPVNLGADGNMNFQVTSVDADMSLSGQRDPAQYLENGWKWGDGVSTGTDTTTTYNFTCNNEESSEYGHLIAGGAQVLSLNLKEYYKNSYRDAVPPNCAGTFAYDIKTFEITEEKPETEHYYYDSEKYPDGKLIKKGPSLFRKCIPSNTLKNYWFPTLKTIAYQEAGAEPNPYKMWYGSGERVDFILTSDDKLNFSGDNLWSMEFRLKLSNRQCISELCRVEDC